MTQLSQYLAASVVGLCALSMGVGLHSRGPFELMLLTAVSLALAAAPESLPVVATVSLAPAASQMSARHAIVRNLAAFETLGSATLLASDKTGTLPQARMAVTGTRWPPDRDEETLLRALVQCDDATSIQPRAHRWAIRPRRRCCGRRWAADSSSTSCGGVDNPQGRARVVARGRSCCSTHLTSPTPSSSSAVPWLPREPA